MELKHIPLDQLHISPLNMRDGKKAPSVADILPSIRARGILQPLLVRQNAEGFEVVAGRRRYFSAKEVEKERGTFDPIPCAVMDAGDDAAAVEASLIENIARLDADEMKQYETFTKLITEGRSVAQIAITFGLTSRAVEQRLALGNLLSKIRDIYREEGIDSDTLQYLTMATKAQQKEWIKLYEDDKAPHGYQLKQWLFGGQSISTKAALFPLEEYKGEIRCDLFGEDSFFADPEAFWAMQQKALDWRKDAYLAAKWSEVVVLEQGQRFDQWAHERTPKTKGGKVFATVSVRGEVEFFEGWLPRAAAKKAKKADGKSEKEKQAERPAMTQATVNYLELHRQAAVRLALIDAPATALRLLVAHAVASSGNWSVKSEAQRSHSNAIKASIEQGAAQRAFEVEREKIEKLLDVPENGDSDSRTAAVFVRLLALKDAQVQRIAAFVMAETLAVGSVAVEAAGTVLEVDASLHWQPDDTFFDLVREKPTLTAMVAQVAGKDVAKVNAGEKAATQKQIIRDAVAGRNGRKKADTWLPDWMAFPFKAYGSGVSGLAETASEAKKLLRKA